MARDAHSDIPPGQRFKQNGIVWEVVKITTFNNIPHAQIMQVGDPTERKLISVAAMLDDYKLSSKE